MSAYRRPTTLDEALSIRAGGLAEVLAGGTDIYPARTQKRAWGERAERDKLDISGISALRGILPDGGGWRIGALTTWTDVARATLPPAYGGLKAAAAAIGGVQVQNRGTLGGNLVTASPAGDGIPCLLSLDASIELQSVQGVRTMPLGAFLTGYRTTALRDDELVTAILVPEFPAPPQGGSRGAFVKLGARHSLVISIAMVSAVVTLDGVGRIAAAQVAVGACSAVAQRLTELERDLIGAPMSEAGRIVRPAHVSALTPIDDVRGSASYRLSAALLLTADALDAIHADVPAEAA